MLRDNSRWNLSPSSISISLKIESTGKLIPPGRPSSAIPTISGTVSKETSVSVERQSLIAIIKSLIILSERLRSKSNRGTTLPIIGTPLLSTYGSSTKLSIPALIAAHEDSALRPTELAMPVDEMYIKCIQINGCPVTASIRLIWIWTNNGLHCRYINKFCR